MPDYRLYLLDRHDRIRRAIMLECDDDSHAVNAAEAHRNGQPMELWRRQHMVKAFPAIPE